MSHSPIVRRIPTLATYAVVTLALTLGILWLIPANSVVLMPGSAQPLCSLVHVQGQKCQSSAGGLYDTYVDELNANHLLYVMLALFRPNVTVEPANAVSNGCPNGQYQSQLMQMMAESKIEAEASALGAAGYRVRTEKWGPQIQEVDCGTPAAAKLRAGDRIVAVDGRAINGLRSSGAAWPCGAGLQNEAGCSIFQQVHDYVGGHTPGATVNLTIIRGGQRSRIPVRSVAGDSQGNLVPGGNTTYIGIVMSLPFKFPVKVDINSGNVGGPSAGLAFALGIYQQLTHKDLTRGNRVAVTGTITYQKVVTGKQARWDGVVGEIGGVRQKAVAAQAAGAKYFLVPAPNLLEARAARTNLIIYPVSSLSDAIARLKSLPAAPTHPG